MMYKWIGAALIIVGCGAFGFGIAATQKREVALLRQLMNILKYMECELEFHFTPLPTLCRQAAAETSGTLCSVFQKLADELDGQISPDAARCMHATIQKHNSLPQYTQAHLYELGQSLGTFDMSGQLKGLASVRESCNRSLQQLENNKDVRLRSYQTLGLCAGAALVILLI